MLFKQKNTEKIIVPMAVSLILVFLVGCADSRSVKPDTKNENLIGTPLLKNSSLQTSSESDSNKIVVFDKTIHKIHLFDLNNMTHLGKFEPSFQKNDHYLIYHDPLNYFIDLSKKNLNITRLDGFSTKSPLHFKGEPVSAAFDPAKGYLVIYDDLQSVGILSLGPSGDILGSYLSGPVSDDFGTLLAGDISKNGKLVLATQKIAASASYTVENRIVSIDIDGCLKAQSLSTKTATLSAPKVVEANVIALETIVWLAPIDSTGDWFLIRSNNKISLFNIQDKTLKSVETDNWVVEKYSKTKNPHIIMRKQYEYDTNEGASFERKIYFVENGEIKTKSSFNKLNYILSSILDLKNNSWSLITANYKKELNLFSSYNEVSDGRSFIRYRFSDLLSLYKLDIFNQATIEIANNFLLSLYPSEMGKAVKTDLDSQSETVLRNFNVKDF